MQIRKLKQQQNCESPAKNNFAIMGYSAFQIYGETSWIPQSPRNLCLSTGVH